MSDGPDPQALALAGGMLWSISVFLAGLGANLFDGWLMAVQWLGQFYIGYSTSLSGAVIGAVWGFLDVFIGLYAFAYLYRYFKNNPVF